MHFCTFHWKIFFKETPENSHLARIPKQSILVYSKHRPYKMCWSNENESRNWVCYLILTSFLYCFWIFPFLSTGHTQCTTTWNFGWDSKNNCKKKDAIFSSHGRNLKPIVGCNFCFHFSAWYLEVVKVKGGRWVNFCDFAKKMKHNT